MDFFFVFLALHLPYLVSLWTTYYIPLTSFHDSLHNSDHFCTLYITLRLQLSTREVIGLCTFKHIAIRTHSDQVLIYCILFIRVYTYLFLFLLVCSMQPIDIPLPRQTSSFHSSESPIFGSPTSTPVASSRNTFRSRRITTAPHARPSAGQRQWSLFGQLMEIEGLPSSIDSTPKPNSDGNISVREHDPSSPNLSPRLGRQLSSSFHTQYSTEPASYDAPYPITTEPDGLSSSAASLDLPSRPTQSYLPFRLLTFTNTHRNVLKCAIAYFVGSLFTFSPHLTVYQ